MKLSRHTLWGTMFGAGVMWMSVFGVSQTQVPTLTFIRLNRERMAYEGHLASWMYRL